MNANCINANKGIHSTHDTDTLAARMRRTAIAGAAAVALSGGGMVSANAATEFVSEASAAEKNWKRIAGAAAKQAVPSLDRARQVLANAADKKAELAMALMVESKQKKALMDASDAVLKAEGNLFQRGLSQAEKNLDKARTHLGKATEARETTQAIHEYLVQEKGDAARKVWQNTAIELAAGTSKPVPSEPKFVDASDISVDDFFKRIDSAIALGKANNEKIQRELNKSEFLTQMDHEIAKAKRALALLKAKQPVTPMIAKAPVSEVASTFDAPALAVATVSEVSGKEAAPTATEKPVVAFSDASDKDWRDFFKDLDSKTKEGAKKIAEIVESSEHATDEDKQQVREVVAEITDEVERRLFELNGANYADAGEDTTTESETTDAIDTHVAAEESVAVEPSVAQRETSTRANDAAAQAMASGVVLTQMANAAQQNADLFRKGMQDRLSGDDAFMQPTDIASTATGISTWVQAMGGQTTGQTRGDIAGYSVRGAGVAAGVDVKKNNSRVGVAVGYGDATVDANGENSQKASSKVSTYSVGLYGAHEVDGWFANGGVSYSAHSIKSQRAAKLGGEVYGLTGKTSATTVGGFAQFGKHIVTRAVNIDPSITLKVSNTSVKGFTENGDAGLKVDGSNFNSARVGIGARLWKAFGDESHSITPSLRIAYERELAHAAPSMDVALANVANTGTMTVTGNKLGRDIVSAEAGIDVKFGKKLSLHGGVNGSVRQGQTQAGVAGSLKYVW
ncbi:MAG: autotransporter domain-containing protein [Pandoraea sp.]|nr:autotransporter domain-containing protein [Pandoraea sp.]MDR3396666.1 autotransporter domain-containing protein [Pandoraea sp.]